MRIAPQASYSCEFNAYGKDLGVLRSDASARAVEYFGPDRKVTLTIGPASPHLEVGTAAGVQQVMSWVAHCKASTLEAS